jgi:4-hydroxy-tetrahydrodipicolinate synthase
MILRGAMTALVTPFTDDDRVDVDAIKRLAQAQIDGGIDGLIVSGTTGESATLTVEDCKAAFHAVKEVAAGKVPVILGTGSNCTKKAVAASKLAKEWGADAALVVCPYYNKPTQEGMFQHFVAVHEESGIDVVAYNVPGRTASDLLPATIARLVDASAIIAVKDATANMQRAVETLDAVDSSRPFSLMSGDDFTILPFVACGGSGVISVVSHLAPGDCAELVRAVSEGRFDVARALQTKLITLSSVLFSVSNPIPVKAGTSILGFGSPRTRLPLETADDAVMEMVRNAMLNYGGIL